ATVLSVKKGTRESESAVGETHKSHVQNATAKRKRVIFCPKNQIILVPLVCVFVRACVALTNGTDFGSLYRGLR
uniref:Uncharacterized protein n=1 Tax=Anopheles quadriannulatus TaxID=34691 RepID=A0A182XQQ9_ANOQN